MSSPAFQRGWRKGLRTIAQLAAGGALTALISALVGGLDPDTQAIVIAAWTAVVAALQNGLEARGTIPALLPSPGLVPSVGTITTAAGTVETAVEQVGDAVGEVTGVVESVGGELLGEVVDVDREDG